MIYLNNKTGFLGVNNNFKTKQKVVVVPFGLEKTVSYGGGTKNGPKEIIKASHQVELFDEELNNLAKNLCMHISATKPISIDIASLDKNVINNEKSILLDNIKSSGKPKNIINKIIDGKINKFYEEVVLLEQKFIIDNETKIKDLLTNYCKNNNIKVNIIDFKLFVLGN